LNLLRLNPFLTIGLGSLVIMLYRDGTRPAGRQAPHYMLRRAQ